MTSHQLAPGQTKLVGYLLAPQLYVALQGFFLHSSNCSEFSLWPNFIYEKMLFRKACWDFVWACLTEEGQQSVCTPRMEKIFQCFRDYWTYSFQNESVPSSRDYFHSLGKWSCQYSGANLWILRDHTSSKFLVVFLCRFKSLFSKEQPKGHLHWNQD